MNKKILILTVLVIVIISAIVFSTFRTHPVEIKEPVNIQICNGIVTNDLKTICLAIFNNQPSKCKEIGNFDTYCYDIVFDSMSNVTDSLCSSFSDYYPRTTCYFRLAKQEKNLSICEKSSGRYQQCSWELAKLTNNHTLCDNLETEFEKDECLAEVTGSDSYCKKISSELERGTCFIKLGKNVDVKKCGEVAPIENPSYAYTQLCISNVALEAKDISLCNLLDNKEGKWRCIAQLSKSISVCDKGETKFWEDFCRIEFIRNSLKQI